MGQVPLSHPPLLDTPTHEQRQACRQLTELVSLVHKTPINVHDFKDFIKRQWELAKMLSNDGDDGDVDCETFSDDIPQAASLSLTGDDFRDVKSSEAHPLWQLMWRTQCICHWQIKPNSLSAE